MIAGRSQLELSLGRILPGFWCIATWITPVVAFYVRDSLWAASTAAVLAAIGSGVIYRYHLAIGEPETGLAYDEPQTIQPSRSTRVIPLTLATLLLQLAALSIAASKARPTSILVGGAIFVISLFHHTTTASNRSRSLSRSQNTARLLVTVALAIVFVGASLTPYLAVPSGGVRSANTSASNERPASKRRGSVAQPKATLLNFVGSLFRRFPTGEPHLADQGRSVGETSTHRPYPALQTLFGESGTVSGWASNSVRRRSNKSESITLVAGDSYPGMILRPETKDQVMIVPPLARREVFDAQPNESIDDPVSIPFYGAYWFFKSSDKTLPADAIESRGDPASTSFKTTDYSPISMEARQNFGSLIDLSCCRAIELVISNGDRRPGTVAVELILSNTRGPGQPRQSLGVLPVNSTLRWFPGDDRPPVTEVLSFRLPAQSATQKFDEAIIKFELRTPREQWSAKIAIDKFRLIPRGL